MGMEEHKKRAVEEGKAKSETADERRRQRNHR
jgi:hypothetical protein